MVSLINKQLLLTAYAYLFIMEQKEAQQGSEALQLQAETGVQVETLARLRVWRDSVVVRKGASLESAKVETLPYGTDVEQLGQVDQDGRVKIRTPNGNAGFANFHYLEDDLDIRGAFLRNVETRETRQERRKAADTLKKENFRHRKLIDELLALLEEFNVIMRDDPQDQGSKRKDLISRNPDFEKYITDWEYFRSPAVKSGGVTQDENATDDFSTVCQLCTYRNGVNEPLGLLCVICQEPLKQGNTQPLSNDTSSQKKAGEQRQQQAGPTADAKTQAALNDWILKMTKSPFRELGCADQLVELVLCLGQVERRVDGRYQHHYDGNLHWPIRAAAGKHNLSWDVLLRKAFWKQTRNLILTSHFNREEFLSKVLAVNDAKPKAQKFDPPADFADFQVGQLLNAAENDPKLQLVLYDPELKKNCLYCTVENSVTTVQCEVCGPECEW